jgi:hypothetical protein
VVDYETEITSLHWGAEFGPTAGWMLAFEGAFTSTEGSFGTVELELPEESLDHADYDFTMMSEYSELKYETLEFHGRGSREIARNTSFTFGAGVVDFDDDLPWVYGDLSGSVVYTRAGIATTF